MDTMRELLGIDKLPFAIADERVTDRMDLSGKVAAVTGGGGPNLGQAICHRLAGLGASVAVIDTVDENAGQVAAAVADRWGVEARAYQADITHSVAVSETVGNIASDFGTIDIWVNNVGLATLPGQEPSTFMDLRPSDIEWFVDVDLLGALFCTRAVLDVMLPRGSGRIVNIASESGKSWAVKRTLYTTCKAGIIGFTRTLSHELAGTGVSLVAVCPGVMLNRGLVESWSDDVLASAVDRPENVVLRTAMSRVSAGRASLAEEVANVVAFLSTEAGGYIQATAVSAGGGMSDG